MRHKKLWIFIIVLVVIAILFGVVRSRNATAPDESSNSQTVSDSDSSPKSKADSKSNSTDKSKTLPQPQTTPQQSASFNKQRYSITSPTSPWVIVNKKHPVSPKTYAPSDLVSTGHGQYLRAEAARALTRMLNDARAAGYVVTPASGYRSYNTQVSVYNNEVKTYGKAAADTQSARPGYSEHQTGWAIDLASGGCSIEDCFGNTPGGKWITANAYKYGFLLRYTPDKVNITGYRGETWHFRYIGTSLSTEMRKKGVKTLEEFFGVSGGNYN